MSGAGAASIVSAGRFDAGMFGASPCLIGADFFSKWLSIASLAAPRGPESPCAVPPWGG